MNLNDLFNEEKVRLDPKCWTGKKIGNPKTKVKGGVRVNNCVPAESVEELNEVNRNNPFDKNRPLPGDPGLAQWQHDHPVQPIQINPLGMAGGAVLRNIARDMATGRNVGGKAIPSLGQPGKVVTSPTMDKILTKLGGKNVEIVPGPTSKPASTNVRIDPAADVPAYIRKGLPDPITSPKLDTKAAVIRKRDNPKFDPNLSKTDPRKTLDQREFDELMAKMDKLQVQQGKPRINAKDYEAQLASQKELEKQLQGKPRINAKDYEAIQAIKKRIEDQLKDPRPAVWKDPKNPNAPASKSPPPADVAPPAPLPYKSPSPAKPKEKTQALSKTYADVQMSQYNDYLNNKQLYLKDHPYPYSAAMRDRNFTQFKKENGYEHPDKADFDIEVMAAHHRANQDRRGSPGGRPTGQKSQYELEQDAKKRGAWKNPDTDIELEEQSRKKREQPEVNYDDEYDAMVARVKKLAGLGPLKTVYDPNKRQYRNMPTAVQPPKK